MKRLFMLAALAAAAVVAAPASAAPILYTLSGEFVFDAGSSTWEIPLVFTGEGDTDDAFDMVVEGVLTKIVPLSDFVAEHDGGTVSLGNQILLGAVPSFEVAPSTAVGVIGFGTQSPYLFVTFQSPQLLGYNGLGSIGPMDVNFLFSTPIDLDGFDDQLVAVNGARFQASVPEPATWATMIGGFGLVGGVMRRRSGKVRNVSYSVG